MKLDEEHRMQCPCCQLDAYHELVEWHGSYTLHHCQGCDLTFSQPMTAPGAAWYEQNPEYVYRDEMKAGEVRWNHRQFLAAPVESSLELLDIGCGTGAFLRAARTKGYRVTGLDFDRHAVQVARERFDLTDVHALSLDEFAEAFPGRRFDVITFFEVLEHQDDPMSFLLSVRRLLKADGIIALSVPYRDRRPFVSFSWDYPPHHLTRWSTTAIQNITERSGFVVRTTRIGWLGGANILRERLQTARITNTLASAQAAGIGAEVKKAALAMGSGALRAAGSVLDLGLQVSGATGIDLYVEADQAIS